MKICLILALTLISTVNSGTDKNFEVSCNVKHCIECSTEKFCEECYFLFEPTNGGNCKINFIEVGYLGIALIVFMLMVVVIFKSRRRRKQEDLDDFYRKTKYINEDLSVNVLGVTAADLNKKDTVGEASSGTSGTIEGNKISDLDMSKDSLI